MSRRRAAKPKVLRYSDEVIERMMLNRIYYDFELRAAARERGMEFPSVRPINEVVRSLEEHIARHRQTEHGRSTR